MPNINIAVGACYGLRVATSVMGEFKVFNGRVVAESTKNITLRFLDKKGITEKIIPKKDIIDAVKL